MENKTKRKKRIFGVLLATMLILFGVSFRNDGKIGISGVQSVQAATKNVVVRFWNQSGKTSYSKLRIKVSAGKKIKLPAVPAITGYKKLGEALKKMNISGAEDVNIRLLVNDDPWSIQEGTEIKRQWEKKLGISVELETATGDAFWAEKDNGTVTLTGVIAEYADMMAYLQSWNYDYTYGELYDAIKKVIEG